MEFAIENSIIGKIMKRGKSLRDEKKKPKYNIRKNLPFLVNPIMIT